MPLDPTQKMRLLTEHTFNKREEALRNVPGQHEFRPW